MRSGTSTRSGLLRARLERRGGARSWVDPRLADRPLESWGWSKRPVQAAEQQLLELIPLPTSPNRAHPIASVLPRAGAMTTQQPAAPYKHRL
eukprot:359586-Chlamydomonas_euryale.AAC.21